MAYRIDYKWDKEKQLTKKKFFPNCLFLGVITVTSVLALRFLFPQIPESFAELFHPFTDENVATAFSELIQQLSQGTSAEESFLTFCQDILSYGE